MSEQPHDTASQTQSAHWDALYASVDNVLRQRPLYLQNVDTSAFAHLRGIVDCGIQSVPIYKIISEPSRYAELDFWFGTHTLSQNEPEPSARRVSNPFRSDPVALYKVGDNYFVKDGNYRVSVARARGQVFLPAHVTEYLLAATESLPQMRHWLLLEEHRAFFDATGLAQQRPDHRIVCTALGSYPTLLQHASDVIGTPQQPLAPEAATHWYDQHYMPLVELLRRHCIPTLLPQYSETDLFVWAMDRSRRPLAHTAGCPHRAVRSNCQCRSGTDRAALRAVALLRRGLSGQFVRAPESN